jgi:hypothetical protein
MINPHRVYPTTQKKGLFLVLPWCRDWLGLVIGSFSSAGGVVDMPRMPDGRAGVYNRVGLLSRGLGAIVNTCKQCQMWQAGGCARCYTHWGDIGAGNFIFGCSRVRYAHLGCFGAPGGAGASAKPFENVFQESGLPN